MSRSVALGSLVLFCTLGDCRGPWSNYALSQDTTQMRMATFLKQSIQASRLELRRGVVSVQGIKHQNDFEGDFKIFNAFDHDLLRVRLDREDSVIDDATGARIQELGQFVRTPEKLLYHRPGDSVSIMPIHRLDPDFARPFDVRILGLGFYGDVVIGKDFEFVWKYYDLCQITSVTTKSPGIHEVTWESTKQHVRKTMIDENRGFWPIETRIYNNGLPEPSVESSLTLANIDGYWVPATYYVREGSNWVRLELKWTSVNQPIPDSYFEYSSFRIGAETRVVDLRTAKPTLVEILGSSSNSTSGGLRNLGLGAVMIFCAILAFISWKFVVSNPRRQRR